MSRGEGALRGRGGRGVKGEEKREGGLGDGNGRTKGLEDRQGKTGVRTEREMKMGERRRTQMSIKDGLASKISCGCDGR